jgi:hypothetical protein
LDYFFGCAVWWDSCCLWLDEPESLWDTSTGSDNVIVQGATLLSERCTQCHSLSRVKNSGYTLDEWKTIIAQMVQMGAQLTSQEEDIPAQYLAQTYP